MFQTNFPQTKLQPETKTLPRRLQPQGLAVQGSSLFSGDQKNITDRNICQNQKTTSPSEDMENQRLGNRWVVEWTPEEDALLFDKYIQMGSRWVELTQFFQGKTDNAIKNRFYCCMRKVQRKMNKVQKQRKLKHRKPISYDSLLTILEIGKYEAQTDDKRFENIKENMRGLMELRQIIIETARKPEEKIQNSKIQQLITKFVQLKFSLKFINIQRVKKSVKLSPSDKQDSKQKQALTSDQSTLIEKSSVSFQSSPLAAEPAGPALMDLGVPFDRMPCFYSEQFGRQTLLETYSHLICSDVPTENFDHLFFI